MGAAKIIHSILGPHAKREFGGAGVTDNFIEASAMSGTLATGDMGSPIQ
jgi:hypothetical protein